MVGSIQKDWFIIFLGLRITLVLSIEVHKVLKMQQELTHVVFSRPVKIGP